MVPMMFASTTAPMLKHHRYVRFEHRVIHVICRNRNSQIQFPRKRKASNEQIIFHTVNLLSLPLLFLTYCKTLYSELFTKTDFANKLLLIILLAN